MLRLLIACSQLLFHIFYDIWNTGIALMFFERLKQIQLRIFLDFNTQVIELLDRRIAARFLHILQRLHHMNLALHDTNRTFVNIRRLIFRRIRLHQRFASIDRQTLRETVTANLLR